MRAVFLIATSAWLCALQINACEWAELQFNYVSGTMSTGQGLQCEGDCNTDEDCAGDLQCYQRGQTGNTNPPPGCYGSFDNEALRDFCYDPNCDAYVIDYVAVTPDSELHNCQMDCDNNDQCAGDLICFERNAGDTDFPPGCFDPNDLSEYDASEGYDICYDADYVAEAAQQYYWAVPGTNHGSTEWKCTESSEKSESITVSCCTVDGADCVRRLDGTDTNDACKEDMDWEDAAAECAAIGRRLCTADELADYESVSSCSGTGCLYDFETAWSSTACDPTMSPTPSPTAFPTPAPTHLQMECGTQESVSVTAKHYLQINVRMSYDGDMILDATDAGFELDQILAWRTADATETHVAEMREQGESNMLTVSGVARGEGISFSLDPQQHQGTFDVRILCESDAPTSTPTDAPSEDPTASPTDPTANPTEDPTRDPTDDPTRDPSADPTRDPTDDPTRDPSTDPTRDPTNDPTRDPSVDPTRVPTDDPTRNPTNAPTGAPTKTPTHEPTDDPTNAPSAAPSVSCESFGDIDDFLGRCSVNIQQLADRLTVLEEQDKAGAAAVGPSDGLVDRLFVLIGLLIVSNVALMIYICHGQKKMPRQYASVVDSDMECAKV